MATDLTVIREIAPSARIAPEAEIGPFCVIGPNVTIGPGTVFTRRVSVSGYTSIGSGNRFGEGCVIGGDPQDLKFAGGQTLVVIGHSNWFGQDVTIHPGTEVGGYVTRVGNANVVLDGGHIAHDCYVDNRTHIGRNALLAGHIHVQTGAVVGDLVGVHHFVTVGRFARIGPGSPVRRDVPPFTYFCHTGDFGSTPTTRGIHEEGIAAARLDEEEEKELRRALSELFEDEAALQTKIEQLVNLGVEGEAAELCLFCQQSLKGVFGRYRELFRGKIPPEAYEYLTPEKRSKIERGVQ